MLLINRNYTRLWLGYAVSGLGDQIFNMTVVLWIAVVLLPGHRLAPLAVGGVLMATSVATILIGPIAGVFVDRWDKRRTMLVTDAIRAAVVGALATFAFLPAGTLATGPTLAFVYATILFTAAATQFFRPAWFTLTSDIVPDEAGQARAAGINQATMATMAIIGPPLATPLLFGFGYRWALLLNAISFLVSYVAVAGIRPPAVQRATGAKPGVWRELREGLAFLRRHSVMRTLLIAAMIVTAGGGAINTLEVFFVTDNLRVDAAFVGYLGTAEGVGLIAGSIVTGWLVAKLGGQRVFWIGLVVTGAFVVIFARQSSFVPAMFWLAACGVAMGTVNAAMGPLIMGAVPRELMGRVVSVFAPAQQLTAFVSAWATGTLAATVLTGLDARIGPFTFGRIDTVFVVAGLLFVAGGVYAGFILRRRRGSDRETHPCATPAPAEPA